MSAWPDTHFDRSPSKLWPSLVYMVSTRRVGIKDRDGRTCTNATSENGPLPRLLSVGIVNENMVGRNTSPK